MILTIILFRIFSNSICPPGGSWASLGHPRPPPGPPRASGSTKMPPDTMRILAKTAEESNSLRAQKIKVLTAKPCGTSRKRPSKSWYSFEKWICVFTMLGTVCPSTFSGHGFYEVSVSQTLKIFRKRSPKFEHVWRFGRHTLHHSRTPAISGSTFFPLEAAGKGWKSTGDSCESCGRNGSRNVGSNPCSLRPSHDDAR